MAELIDRKEIFFEGKQTGNKEYDEGFLDGAMCVLNAIDEMSTANEWISVKDRLPEDRGNVLAWSPRYNEVVIAWYHEEEDFWRTDDNFAPFPTHWMPLPEPPKGE